LRILPSDLEETYRSKQDDELLSLYVAQDLTEEARQILESELRTRGLEIPAPSALEKALPRYTSDIRHESMLRLSIIAAAYAPVAIIAPIIGDYAQGAWRWIGLLLMSAMMLLMAMGTRSLFYPNGVWPTRLGAASAVGLMLLTPFALNAALEDSRSQTRRIILVSIGFLVAASYLYFAHRARSALRRQPPG
jgi:hypothetical protein